MGKGLLSRPWSATFTLTELKHGDMIHLLALAQSCADTLAKSLGETHEQLRIQIGTDGHDTNGRAAGNRASYSFLGGKPNY